MPLQSSEYIDEMATTLPSTNPIADEPFGQMGVRERIAPLASKLSQWLVIAGLMLWVLSVYYSLQIGWLSNRSKISLDSTLGRLMIERVDFADTDVRTKSGLLFHMERLYFGRDRWRWSIWRQLGVEWRNQPSTPDAAGGWWVRIAWRDIVGVALIIPTIQLIKERRIRRREAREERAKSSQP
jgi:hypothetical protein